MSFVILCLELENKIKNAYTSGVTPNEAEQLAGEFLHAQMKASDKLKELDLDYRMRKTGVKAIRAAIFLDEVRKTEKKPSDTMLEALVTNNDLVQIEQDTLDKAEADKDALERYYNIFREGHIFFRGVAKGRFE